MLVCYAREPSLALSKNLLHRWNCVFTFLYKVFVKDGKRQKKLFFWSFHSSFLCIWSCQGCSNIGNKPGSLWPWWITSSVAFSEFPVQCCFLPVCEILRILWSLISFCHGQMERRIEQRIHCVGFNYTAQVCACLVSHEVTAAALHIQ